jgi:hypothetical protein
MTTRIGRVLFAAFLVAASAALAFNAPLGGDYPASPCQGSCDFGGPSIAALIHGDASRFFAEQPLMGSFSLLVRAPFAGVASAFDGGILWEYRLGVFPCLLAVALLGAWLWRLMAARGQSVLARVAVLAICLVSPMTFKALFWGHPEEMLAAALCAGAIILATRGRASWAGLLLGLAIATKQWAVLAILPTLIAARKERVRLCVFAAAAAALLIVPMAIGDFGRFWSNIHGAAGKPSIGLTPTNIWWPYGHDAGLEVVRGNNAAAAHALDDSLGALSHPLIMLIGIALPLLYWRARPERRPEDALLLLALILLVRCLLDPLTFSYHHAPFLIALVAYEGLRRRGLPVLAIFATVALYLTAYVIAPSADPNVLNRFYIAWTLPLAAYMVLSLYFPEKAQRLDRRLRLHRPVGAAAG